MGLIKGDTRSLDCRVTTAPGRVQSNLPKRRFHAWGEEQVKVMCLNCLNDTSKPRSYLNGPE